MLTDSLLVFSKMTEFVYGFEKNDAALFLEIDVFLSKGYAKKDIFQKYSEVPKELLRRVYALLSCQELDNIVEYQPKKDFGTFIKSNVSRITYTANHVSFLIHYPNNDLYNTIHPVISHLQGKDLKKRCINVDERKKGKKWQVIFNDIPITEFNKISTLALGLQENMLIALYQSKPHLITIHAAAAQYNNKLFILPAVSGSGKTTLTTALMHHDFRIYSDELTVISRKGKVSTLPFSLNIKEGSWKIIANMYPDFNATGYHIRFDKQRVKFLKLNQQFPSHKGKRPTHLIFPQYKKGAKTRLIELSACEALNRIKQAGYQLDKSLTKGTFEDILIYLLALPKFSLEYSSLTEAVNVIKKL